MGLFSKSKHKEEKKTLENQKKLQPLGPGNRNETAERVSHNRPRPSPEEYAARKQQVGQVKNGPPGRERPMTPAHMNDKRNTPLPPLARPTQRAEFPINGPVHDAPEEISQKDMEFVLSENKMLEKTIHEIRKKLYIIKEETNHISRLDENLDDLKQQLKQTLSTSLQTNFEETKFNRFLRYVEDDAQQLCADVWEMYNLFGKVKKDDWKPLLWKRTFKSFDQLDKRPQYQKMFNESFQSNISNVDEKYLYICKKIGRVTLQNKYDTIPESDRVVNIFEAVSKSDQDVKNKVPSNQNEKLRDGPLQKSQQAMKGAGIESDTRSLGIKENEGRHSSQSESSRTDNSQALNKKTSKAGMAIKGESPKSNRLSIYEIEEIQQKREKGVPKRTSSLAMYMDESMLTQLKEDERQRHTRTPSPLLDKHKK